MFFVFTSLLSGVMLGRIFRSETLQSKVQLAVKVLVLGLLFTMGVQLGTNTTIWNSLGTIGVASLAITFGSVGGSILANGAYSLVSEKTKRVVKKSFQKES